MRPRSATLRARRRPPASSTTPSPRSSAPTTSSTTPAIRSFTICAARRCTSSDATTRRGASTTSRSSRSARRPTARMEKLWLARIYARRGYVVLADRLYESMLPAPPATDAEVALNQADAHLINEDWRAGRRRAAPLPGARAEERPRARDAGLGARGGRRSRRRARGAAQPVGRSADARPRPRLRAGAGARRELRGRARSLQARARRGGRERRRDARRPRTARMLLSHHARAGRAARSLRSDPQAWAWRVQAGAAMPFGTRHALGVLAWHDSSSDWHANQVVGSNVLSKSGTVTGLGAAALARAAARTTSLLLGADARYATEAGGDANGADQLFGRQRLSLRRAGRRRPRTSGST